ncbi:MAG: hypothetical protein ACW98K_09135, partial [Candidatus Kariarchaeaceae archaeon]
MNFPATPRYYFGIYRMERIRFSPLLNSLDDVNVLIDEEIKLKWETHYNFRAKKSMQGSYQLYLNDSIVQSGNHTFKAFWTPTALDLSLDPLPQGNYNLTLVVLDDGGHATVNQVNITSSIFYIFGEGPLAIEKGQNSADYLWIGDTVVPLNVTLQVNDSQVLSVFWNGTNIIFDLNDLELGFHILTLRVYNQTEILLQEKLEIQVYPLAILTSPINHDIFWNETLVLTWVFSDSLPLIWHILLNGKVLESSPWNNSTYTLHWKLPTLDEDEYDVSLLLLDRAGLSTTSTVIVTVLPPLVPVIAKTPSQKIIEWGITNAQLQWEIHGASRWHLERNEKFFRDGNITGKYVTIPINWQADLWKLDNYELSMTVYNDENDEDESFSLLTVQIPFADAYANDVDESNSFEYLSGALALGAPDQRYAVITSGYSPGMLTLDMKNSITDGPGTDFTVYTQGGKYSVSIIQHLNAPEIILVEEIQGISNFDLGSKNISSARYVKINHFDETGNPNVEVDAIVARYFENPDIQNEIPTIQGPKDLTLWYNRTQFTANWYPFSLTPWNYSIFINSRVVEQGPWTGNDISFTVNFTEVRTYKFTLQIYNLFDKFASHNMTLEVIRDPQYRSSLTQTITTAIAIIVIFLIIVPQIVLRRSRTDFPSDRK